MILRDPYGGHRHDDVWWQPDPVRDTQWTEWDYAILDAYTAIEMMRSGQSGQLRNLTEDPDVYWEVEALVDFAAKTVVEDRKDKEDEPGVQFYPAKPSKNGPFWTFEQWLEYQASESRSMDRGMPDGARPPTPEELMAMQARRRARAEDPSLN